MLIFDIVKAFNKISLIDMDQCRLLFLWYDNINDPNSRLIAYKNKRLSFGLRCSPAILMLSLYKVLVLDNCGTNHKLNKLKALIYQLTYMNNCAVTSDSTDYLMWAYHGLNNIFSPYKFTLQKFATNNSQLKEEIVLVHSESQITEQEDPFNVVCSIEQILVQDLLCLKWDMVHDCVFADKLDLKAREH